MKNSTRSASVISPVTVGITDDHVLLYSIVEKEMGHKDKSMHDTCILAVVAIYRLHNVSLQHC